MLSEQAASLPTELMKCSIRGCKGFGVEFPILMCANKPRCSRKLHSSCCQSLVLSHNNRAVLCDLLGAIIPCCTKKCYNTVEPKYNGKTRLVWEKDGALGPEDPNNLLNLLLDWMTTEGNYACF